MKYQFITLDTKEQPTPERETFLEAWNDMYKYVKKLLDANQMDYQLLETAIWIDWSGNGFKVPIFFYDARDQAINEGWQNPA